MKSENRPIQPEDTSGQSELHTNQADESSLKNAERDIEVEEKVLFGHVYGNFYIICTDCDLSNEEIKKIIKDGPLKNKIWFIYNWITYNPRKKDLHYFPIE